MPAAISKVNPASKGADACGGWAFRLLLSEPGVFTEGKFGFSFLLNAFFPENKRKAKTIRKDLFNMKTKNLRKPRLDFNSIVCYLRMKNCYGSWLLQYIGTFIEFKGIGSVKQQRIK